VSEWVSASNSIQLEMVPSTEVIVLLVSLVRD